MVAVKQTRRIVNELVTPKVRPSGTLELLQGSFSSGRVARQSPVLAGLHRAVDGSLVGVVIAVALMSALTLHWQYRWTLAFTNLERTRMLVHRLTDSTAMLERYFLERGSLPELMVPTKVANLLYLQRPLKVRKKSRLFWSSLITDVSINHGY